MNTVTLTRDKTPPDSSASASQEKKDARANYAEGAKEFVKERAKKVEVEEDYEAKEPEEWEYMAKAPAFFSCQEVCAVSG